MTAQQIIDLLKRFQFNPENEKKLQVQMATVFKNNNVAFRREYYLNDDNHIDFLIGDIGIEVKIKGSKNEIYKQLERYCKFEEVNTIILVTTMSMGMLKEISGKPVRYINLNRAWL